MKKTLVIPVLCIMIAVGMGCNSGSTATADDKQLRKQFAKEKFDINDVPQNQRAMVQGFIDRAKANAAKGQNPGKDK